MYNPLRLMSYAYLYTTTHEVIKIHQFIFHHRTSKKIFSVHEKFVLNDRVRFPDRLQNNSMLPFHATNRKKSLYQPWLAAGANMKIAPVRIFL